MEAELTGRFLFPAGPSGASEEPLYRVVSERLQGRFAAEGEEVRGRGKDGSEGNWEVVVKALRVLNPENFLFLHVLWVCYHPYLLPCTHT